VVTARGIEGGAIYALSASLRETIKHSGGAQLLLDLLPDQTPASIAQALAKPRGKNSFSNHLRKTLKLSRVKVALLHECLPAPIRQQPESLAAALKALPLTLTTPHALDEAISTAGGISYDGLHERLMVNELPGVFCAREMIDWEATTGG
jgi:predicted flavoprotein YhiN